MQHWQTTCLAFLTLFISVDSSAEIGREGKNIKEFKTRPTKYGISLWDGRIVVVPPRKKASVKEDKSFNYCLTSSREIGLCTRLSDCPNFSITSLHNNVCFMNMFVPGVCCPPDLLSLDKIFPIKTTTPLALEATITEKTTTTEKPIDSETTSTNTTHSSTVSQQKQADCGVHSIPSSRIVHGKRSEDGEWPWMAALFANTFLGKKFHCGGSLISSTHVLTGAHCVKDQRGMTFSIKQISVRLGDRDISSLRDSLTSGRFYTIKEIRAHPNFQNINHYFLNDVAVIKLEDEVRLSNNIFPICLPPPEVENGPLDMFAGRYSTVTGYGRTELGTPSNKLLEAKVPVWKNEDCDGAYFAPITDIFICAGYRSGGIDACQGDSGGPLQIEEKNRWTQIGITSFGKGCGEPGFPGVYTRVSKFLKFIRENML